MSYLKWPSVRGSWHAITRVDDAGWHLRCGRTLTTEKAPASDHVPTNERTCERCFVLIAADKEPA